jgi:hypothetical protein
VYAPAMAGTDRKILSGKFVAEPVLQGERTRVSSAVASQSLGRCCAMHTTKYIF